MRENFINGRSSLNLMSLFDIFHYNPVIFSRFGFSSISVTFTLDIHLNSIPGLNSNFWKSKWPVIWDPRRNSLPLFQKNSLTDVFRPWHTQFMATGKICLHKSKISLKHYLPHPPTHGPGHPGSKTQLPYTSQRTKTPKDAQLKPWIKQYSPEEC